MAIILYYFERWQNESDSILSDLCERFINRRLFKYIDYVPTNYETYSELREAFKEAEIDPEYYLVVDSSSDLPYDFYRPGEEGERLPINLLMPDGSLRELSRESEVVEAISGKKRTDHKLYFPADFIQDTSTHRATKEKIQKLLKQ